MHVRHSLRMGIDISCGSVRYGVGDAVCLAAAALVNVSHRGQQRLPEQRVNRVALGGLSRRLRKSCLYRQREAQARGRGIADQLYGGVRAGRNIRMPTSYPLPQSLRGDLRGYWLSGVSHWDVHSKGSLFGVLPSHTDIGYGCDRCVFGQLPGTINPQAVLHRFWGLSACVHGASSRSRLAQAN